MLLLQTIKKYKASNLFSRIKWLIFFSQTEYSPKDETQNCANYPTENYASYDDCYGDFINQTLFDLVPFWVAENLDEASSFYTINRTYNQASKFYADMGN